MKILIIGGSYFLGKAFVQMAKETNEVLLLNRGSRPFTDGSVPLFCMDRHDKKAVSGIPETYFDVVVDFCAYDKGDIETILSSLQAQVAQYIFISTCDVYERGTMRYMDEDSPLEYRSFPGQAGAYIAGKVALEQELRDGCRKRQIAYTSIRPAFIYGPDNYAPREEIYFRWITRAGQILHPVDASGEFQMVYVRDAAKAVLAACGNPQAYNRAFNLCHKEPLTYETFADLLVSATGRTFIRTEVTVQDVMERGIPLPFPLTKEESQWYRGSRIQKLGIDYTPFIEGMKETFLFWQEHQAASSSHSV